MKVVVRSEVIRESIIEEERNAVASTLIKTHYYYIESAIQ